MSVEFVFAVAAELRNRSIWAKPGSWRTSAWLDYPRLTEAGATYWRYTFDEPKFKGLPVAETVENVLAAERVLAMEDAEHN